jgi:hypothetical protein
MDYIALQQLKLASATYSMGDVIPAEELADAKIYTLLKRKVIQYADGGRGGGGSTFQTSATLNTTAGASNTVPLTTLTPASPAPVSGDTIIDGAGTTAKVTSVDATDATAVTVPAGGGVVLPAYPADDNLHVLTVRSGVLSWVQVI